MIRNWIWLFSAPGRQNILSLRDQLPSCPLSLTVSNLPSNPADFTALNHLTIQLFSKKSGQGASNGQMLSSHYYHGCTKLQTGLRLFHAFWLQAQFSNAIASPNTTLLLMASQKKVILSSTLSAQWDVLPWLCVCLLVCLPRLQGLVDTTAQ